MYIDIFSFHLKVDTETLVRNQVVLYLQNRLLNFHYKTWI